MIEERAEVVGFEGDSILVRSARTSACNQCQARHGCGQKSLAEWANTQWVDVQVSNPQKQVVQIGDQVVIGIEEGRFLIASSLIYLLPLVVMILSVVIGTVNALHESSLIVLAGLGLAIGFYLNKLLLPNKGSLNDAYQPELLKVYSAQ